MHYYQIAKESKYYCDDAKEQIEKVSRMSRSTTYRIQDDGIVLYSLYDKAFRWYMPSDIYSAEVYIDQEDDEYLIIMNEDDVFTFASKDKVRSFFCELKASRPFTFLETLDSHRITDFSFIKNGNLYMTCNSNSFLVFDARSGNRIRKLGHFVRMEYRIFDIAVFAGIAVQDPG